MLQGCFTFKPKRAGKKRLDDLNVFTTEPWYKTYSTVLKSIEKELKVGLIKLHGYYSLSSCFMFVF